MHQIMNEVQKINMMKDFWLSKTEVLKIKAQKVQTFPKIMNHMLHNQIIIIK